jgi:hypothetical protein
MRVATRSHMVHRLHEVYVPISGDPMTSSYMRFPTIPKEDISEPVSETIVTAAATLHGATVFHFMHTVSFNS